MYSYNCRVLIIEKASVYFDCKLYTLFKKLGHLDQGDKQQQSASFGLASGHSSRCEEEGEKMRWDSAFGWSARKGQDLYFL